uniref:DNA-binding protein n=1 Tax=Rhinolophus ferrumequinum adenovirus TaxID=3140013 RepID=A0AAU6S559_9ADEN
MSNQYKDVLMSSDSSDVEVDSATAAVQSPAVEANEVTSSSLPPKKRHKTTLRAPVATPVRQRRKQELKPKPDLSDEETVVIEDVSSAEESELQIDEGAARTRKRARPQSLKLNIPSTQAPQPQHGAPPGQWRFSSDSEEDVGCPSTIGFSNPPVKIIHRPDGTVRYKHLKQPPPTTVSNSTPTAEQVKFEAAIPPAPRLDAQEQMWQMAMDMAVEICVPLKVDVKDLTLLPDASTIECFRKAAQAWLNEKKIFINLTFSTQKSLQTMMARFLLDFIMRNSGLQANVNITGAAIWEHHCTDGTGLKCLHGTTMLCKDHTIEMDVNSENGQRALKEQPTKTKITTNRWGRNVVQVKNEEARCCIQDAKAGSGLFTAQSCGMFYSEGPKAEEAFRQIMELQMACYPKMPNAGTRLLMPIKCDCNWGNEALPLLGRQVCKITPFAMSSATNVDKSLVHDKKMLATLNNPSVLVFQCCNPVYRSSKAAPQKNCDFKLSAPDMITSLQLAKQMWQDVTKKVAPVQIPEFKWQAMYQYQNTILPTTHAADDDDNLF